MLHVTGATKSSAIGPRTARPVRNYPSQAEDGRRIPAPRSSPEGARPVPTQILTDFATRIAFIPGRTFTEDQLRKNLVLSARLTYRTGAVRAEATRIRYEAAPRRTLDDWFPISAQAAEAQEYADYVWDEAHADAAKAFAVLHDPALTIVTATELIQRIHSMTTEVAA
jgi:hypothetical protein